MDNSNNQFQPNSQNPSVNNAVTPPATSPPPPSNPESSTPSSWPTATNQPGFGQAGLDLSNMGTSIPTTTQPPPLSSPSPYQQPAPPWINPDTSINPTTTTDSVSWPTTPQSSPIQPVSFPSTQPEPAPNFQAPLPTPPSFGTLQENPLPVTASNPASEAFGTGQSYNNAANNAAGPVLNTPAPNFPEAEASNPADQSSQYTDPNTLLAGNIQPEAQQPPVWSPPTTQTNIRPSENLPLPATTSQDNNLNPSDQAPTDLSHLISNSGSSNPEPPATLQPEAIVVPTVNTAPEVPTIPSENKKGFPKWVIGLGLGLLTVVAGASAYFILGIGQSPQNTSLPATEAPGVNQPANNPSTAPTVPQASPANATGSANFGELEESGSAPQASSAADIVRARLQQQQGR